MADDEAYTLAALGLSAQAEDVYRALLSLPQADVVTLADRLGTSVDSVAQLLPDLLECDLVKMVADDTYEANSPELSIVMLLADRMEQLRNSCSAVGRLERTYRGTRRDDDRQPGLERIVGLEAIRSRLYQLNVRARGEVRLFMRHPLITPDVGGSVRESPLNSAVRYRTLFEKALLDDSDVVATVQDSVRRGQQVRFTATLPIKLAIGDNDRVLIMESGTNPVALFTEHPALVVMAISLFEQVWSAAVPAPAVEGETLAPHPRSGGSLDAEDRLLLSLLLAGLTDQTIAARLGVGLRTVQRRVRDLMDAANVDTRIQLGWQASRKGWV